MRRGYDQPTSSSASRTTNTGTRELTQQPIVRRRQGQYETSNVTRGLNDPTQAQLPSGRRKSQSQHAPPNPQPASEEQRVRPGAKTPDYLQGKNPYGQVLERIDHPYRAPREPSSYPVANDAKFKSQARPAYFERAIRALDPGPRPLPPRQPPKTVSVQAKKNLFEAKASQNRSVPLFPSTQLPPAVKDALSKQTRYAWPLRQVQKDKSPPRVVRRATRRTKPVVPEDHLVAPGAPFYERESTARKRSTNVFNTATEDAKPTDSEPGVTENSNAALNTTERAGRSKQRRTSEETVRRRTTRRSIPAAEYAEPVVPDSLTRQQSTRRSKAGPDVQGEMEQD